MRIRRVVVLAVLCLFVVRLPARGSSRTTLSVLKVPEDYSQIQDAIDAADPGDVIQVDAGIYNEKLKIDKPLTLIGQGPGHTTLLHAGTVLFVERTSNVEIRGFSVQGGTYGIFLYYSSNVTLRDNAMSANKWNFGVWGDVLRHFVHDVASSNTVEGKPIYYLVNQRGQAVPPDAGYVALVNSTEIHVEDAVLTRNEQGILAVATTHSLIENVTATGHDEGFDLRWSHHNTIRRNRLLTINWRALYLENSTNNVLYANTFFNGTSRGLSLRNSSNNTFYHNNFIDNFQQAETALSQNLWHNELQEGNHWSDYSGVDADEDGIGDTVYTVYATNMDPYPLMAPYDQAPPLAHAGDDQTVTQDSVVQFDAGRSFDDVVISNYAWAFGDGSTGTGPRPTHTYAQTGDFTVTLTVTDVTGKSAADTVTITVIEASWLPPWAVLGVGLSIVAAVVVGGGFWWYTASRARKLRDEESTQPT